VSAVFHRLAATLARNAAPVIVTGGGGWLGMASLDLLERLLGPAFPARVRVYGSNRRNLTLPSGASFACAALGDLADYEGPPPLILHHACLTKDRVAALGVDAFLAGNDAIRAEVVGLIRRCGALGVFLPSSGAVYGPDRSTTPDPQGNPYGASKLQDEAAFAEIAATVGAKLVIARVFNLAGPFINKPEAYALASFLAALLEDRSIEIRAAGRVVRSYIHVEDLLLLSLGGLMLSGREVCHFDTEGECTVEVQELAERTRALLGKPEIEILRAAFDGRPDDVYVGDGAAMRVLARDLGIVLRHLDAQIQDTAAYLVGRLAHDTPPGRITVV
jgi:UDP-glucuronate decarboxylase